MQEFWNCRRPALRCPPAINLRRLATPGTPFRRLAGRLGFTLIELMVIVGILTILLVLAVSAVQSSRESSRRLVCMSRLRQIGLAVSSHQSVHGAFPAGIKPNGRTPKGVLFAAPSPLSAHAQLLPYLEQNVLYNALNLPVSSKFEQYSPPTADSPANQTVVKTVLSIFLCPSDGRGAGGNNYRACTGPNPYEHDGAPWPGGGGAFPGLASTTDRDFTDGLSATVGFSERLHGGGNPSRFNPRRDFWFSGLRNIDSTPDRDETAATCAGLTSADPPFWPHAGRHWIVGGFLNTLYNHVSCLNPPTPDCSVTDSASEELRDVPGGSVAARSRHPGGVHVLMMDGSVRFTAETIALPVWRAVATRAGREAATLP